MINKNILKSGYYYEEKDWYDTLANELPEVEYKTEIFTETISHNNILKKYNITPYPSYIEAAAVCANLIKDLKNNYKSRLVYFTENNTLFRFFAWRLGDGQLGLGVGKVGLGNDYGAGRGVCFSNIPLIPSDTTLESSDTLSLIRAIEIVKSNGYKVFLEK